LCRGKLDGQWQTIDPAADFGQDRSIVEGDGEPTVGRLGAIDEKLHALVARHRPNPEDVFTPDAKHRSAGDHDAEVEARAQQIEDERRGVPNVLEIIEDQEQRTASYRARKLLIGDLLAHAQRVGDGCANEIRGAQRREIDKGNFLAQCGRGTPHGLDGKSRLASTAYAGECEQANVRTIEEIAQRR
jgi:hypothetical protein